MSSGGWRLTVDRLLIVNRQSTGNKSCDKQHPNPLCYQLRQKVDLPVLKVKKWAHSTFKRELTAHFFTNNHWLLCTYVFWDSHLDNAFNQCHLHSVIKFVLHINDISLLSDKQVTSPTILRTLQVEYIPRQLWCVHLWIQIFYTTGFRSSHQGHGSWRNLPVGELKQNWLH